MAWEKGGSGGVVSSGGGEGRTGERGVVGNREHIHLPSIPFLRHRIDSLSLPFHAHTPQSRPHSQLPTPSVPTQPMDSPHHLKKCKKKKEERKKIILTVNSNKAPQHHTNIPASPEKHIHTHTPQLTPRSTSHSQPQVPASFPDAHSNRNPSILPLLLRKMTRPRKIRTDDDEFSQLIFPRGELKKGNSSCRIPGMKKLKYLGNISNFRGVLWSPGGGNLSLTPGSSGGPRRA
ncbi:hypothetical protein E2C01_045045 [Portunus trituberculatus]|uniref:Uncharacterized protein n=1 Tax=Portunus trituberculatus TaxID=210409 RepID=A0A5B7G400_PORTR|nr:hypothetical protein [Portunus trituberculatus]